MVDRDLFDVKNQEMQSIMVTDKTGIRS